jgi:hypothetical protein
VIAPERIEEVAAGLEAYLCKEFNADVVDKDTSPLHLAAARGFDAARTGVGAARALASLLSIDVPQVGLPTGEEYLKNFATTVGSTVALPRAWRTPDHAPMRIRLLPHEVVHVDQHQRGVKAGWWPKATTHSVLYLASIAGGDAAEYLGHVEADAYAATEALRGWLGGGRRSTGDITSSLRRHYALAGVGVVVAEATLLGHYKTMDDGGIPNVRVCRLSIDWLETHASDLKGRVQS